jgi:hypothetical protein
MKVKKKNRILLYSWLPPETYHKNMAIWKLIFSEIWWIWAIFSMENPLYRWKSYFPGRNLTRFRQKKIHWNLKWVLDCVIISCTQLDDPFTSITKALAQYDSLDLSVWWIKILRQNCGLQTSTTIVGASPWLCHHSMNSLTWPNILYFDEPFTS